MRSLTECSHVRVQNRGVKSGARQLDLKRARKMGSWSRPEGNGNNETEGVDGGAGTFGSTGVARCGVGAATGHVESIDHGCLTIWGVMEGSRLVRTAYRTEASSYYIVVCERKY